MPERSLRILCVDDEPMMRDLLKETLEHWKHEPVLCDGGQAGIKAFQEAVLAGRPFDAVITDLGMPRVDGRQVADAVKDQAPHTPVILLTGWGALMQEGDELPARVDTVLCKPPRLAELQAALTELTANKASGERTAEAKAAA